MKFHLTPPWGAIPTALLTFGVASSVFAAPLTLNDLPVTVSGTTGGPTATSCGNIAAAPNGEVNLDHAAYLQVSVQTDADATIWIDGSSDFCILRDPTSHSLHTAGHWPEGLYKIYVGDRQGKGTPFSLTVSQ